MSKKNHKGRISLEKELEDIFSELSLCSGLPVENIDNGKTGRSGKKEVGHQKISVGH